MADNNTTVVDTTNLLGLLKSRLEIAKTWCKKPHESMKKWIAEYDIEDVSDIKEVRDKVRIPAVFRRTESDLPAIFDDQPDLFIKGKGKYRAFDNYFGNTYDWLWDSQMLEECVEDAATYFILLGMGFISSPWVTETKEVVEQTTQQQPVVDEQGNPVIDPTTGQPAMQMVPVENKYEVAIKDQPDSIAEDLFKLFFSPETKFSTILDSEHCPYYFKEYTMTTDQIKEKFNKTVVAHEVLHTNITDVDSSIDNMDDMEEYKDDIKRVTVYEYYGIIPKDYSKEVKNQTSPWSFNKDYHVWITDRELLEAEECEYATKPLMCVGNYGLANKFWKSGDAKYMIPLVQELQQYRSQVLKHTRKMANPKPMVPEDANVDDEAFSDPNVGRIVRYTPSATGAKPEYLSPANLGAEVGVGIQQARTDLEQTSGSFQLSEGSNQSTVKTPRGIETFSEAADKNVRRKRKKIARFIRAIIIFQFKQCSMNWKPDDPRVVDILSGGEDQQQGVQPMDYGLVLQLMGDDNILSKVEIEVESLSVNRVQQKQDALDLLDLALKSEAQAPGYIKLDEFWKDVLQNGYGKKDADRYMIPDDVRQQMQQQQAQAAMAGKVGENVSIKADAATPIGAQLLEQAHLLPPGTGQQLQAETQAQDVVKQNATKPDPPVISQNMPGKQQTQQPAQG